ncbi:MAG: DUF2062 domain-containing protein [Halobacteriota archaeon]
MLRGPLDGVRHRFLAELRGAFRDRHPPHEVASSFSFGVFVTTLPTLGTGLLLFAVVAKTVRRASAIALFAPVVLLNPITKWGVYAASYWVGTILLGPIPGVVPRELSLAAGSDVAVRLLLGNLILATVFAVVGYVLVHRGVTAYRRRELDLIDRLPGLGTDEPEVGD